MTKEDSVHLTTWPEVDLSNLDDEIEKEIEKIFLELTELVHRERKEAHLPVKRPLISLATTYPRPAFDELVELFKKEVNVKNVEWGQKLDQTVRLDISETPEILNELQARELIRQIQEERKNLRTSLNEEIEVSLPDWPAEYEEYIKNKALISKLTKGEFSVKRAS